MWSERPVAARVSHCWAVAHTSERLLWGTRQGGAPCTWTLSDGVDERGRPSLSRQDLFTGSLESPELPAGPPRAQALVRLRHWTREGADREPIEQVWRWRSARGRAGASQALAPAGVVEGGSRETVPGRPLVRRPQRLQGLLRTRLEPEHERPDQRVDVHLPAALDHAQPPSRLLDDVPRTQRSETPGPRRRALGAGHGLVLRSGLATRDAREHWTSSTPHGSLRTRMQPASPLCGTASYSSLECGSRCSHQEVPPRPSRTTTHSGR